MMKRRKERGAALIESAITIPIIVLVSVAIFDFGRAYQSWQVLTNAAREGARVSVISGKTDDQVKTVITEYVKAGGLQVDEDHKLEIVLDRSIDFGTNNASKITVTYGFEFYALGPVMTLLNRTLKQGKTLTMGAVAVMRNEN